MKNFIFFEPLKVRYLISFKVKVEYFVESTRRVKTYTLANMSGVSK